MYKNLTRVLQLHNSVNCQSLTRVIFIAASFPTLIIVRSLIHLIYVVDILKEYKSTYVHRNISPSMLAKQNAKQNSK